MQHRNQFLTPRGLLCSIAIAAVYCISAMAMQPQFGQSQRGSLVSAQQQQPTQPDQPAAVAVVVTGTIVKSGDNFVLRDTSGTVYQLDAQEKAQPYEGKSVRVTGKLEAETKLLHVEAIEELTA
jgi:uncharacterized protein YdeI (BOF family)